MCDLSITEVLHHYLYFAFLLPGLPVALATFEDVTDTLRVTTVDCTLVSFSSMFDDDCFTDSKFLLESL
jgi:hypothetical protein